MTKIVRKEQVPASERTVVDHYTCDLCGKRTSTNDSSMWPTEPPTHGSYGVNKTTIELQVGNNYGHDGGDVKYTNFDICPVCFTTKLVSWMKSQGAVPRTEGTEW